MGKNLCACTFSDTSLVWSTRHFPAPTTDLLNEGIYLLMCIYIGAYMHEDRGSVCVDMCAECFCMGVCARMHVCGFVYVCV